MKKVLVAVLVIVAICVVGFGAAQLVPYGKDHTNPPVVSEPKWDSPNTRALAQRACFDCHSNETTWPWYSSVAPVSWLVQHDVDEGRQRLNFSDWQNFANRRRGGEGGEGGGEMGEVIQRGSMPPFYYVIQHPNAGLTDAEKQQLIQGLNASLK